MPSSHVHVYAGIVRYILTGTPLSCAICGKVM